MNFLNEIEPRKVAGSEVIAYGGASLWSCYLSKNKNFKTICKRYVKKCKELHVDIVLFD